MSMNAEQRIIELEIKVSYQDDLLQALNTVISRQQLEIERLEAACRLLDERIKSLAAEVGKSEPLQPEIPPHY